MSRNTYANVVKVNFLKMPIYQTNDYTLLQIKENDFIDYRIYTPIC